MVGEFGSSQKEDEVLLSCEELMAQGASAAAVHANLLCELTTVYKDEAQFAENRDSWLQVLHLPASVPHIHCCQPLPKTRPACPCNLFGFSNGGGSMRYCTINMKIERVSK
jgi:hypothetical protein